MKRLTKNMTNLLRLMLVRHDANVVVSLSDARIQTAKALINRGLAVRNTNYVTAYELTPEGVECARKLVVK